MHRPFKLFLFISVLIFTALACAAGSTGSSDPEVLFQDDFSSQEGGWASQRDSDGIIDFDQDAYRIQILVANNQFWSFPGLDLGDTSSTVEAKKIAGPDENLFGIICRYQDTTNFYAFLAGSDGFYGITKLVNDEFQVLGSDFLEETDAINQGTDTVNTLRADCVGSTLTFFINGKQIAQVQDASFSSGDIGLIAGSGDQPGVDILFDNLVVRKP